MMVMMYSISGDVSQVIERERDTLVSHFRDKKERIYFPTESSD